MRMILIYNKLMISKKIQLCQKSNEYLQRYVKEVTDDLDIMAEKRMWKHTINGLV